MYFTIPGREDKPTNFVSFYDSLRFANWLHNGQPTGAEDNSTTEDGAYTITSEGIAADSITRNEGAAVFVPSPDEWYKAAYYDTGLMTYFEYAAGSDTETACTAPGATPNTANCGDFLNELTDVGSYTGASSPNDTFDQGGNVFEWHETGLVRDDPISRVFASGSYDNEARPAGLGLLVFKSIGYPDLGVRVASPAPEPDSDLLAIASLLALAGLHRMRA